MQTRKAFAVLALVCLAASPGFKGWYASARFPQADQTGALHYLSADVTTRSPGVFGISLIDRFEDAGEDDVAKVFYTSVLACRKKTIQHEIIQNYSPHMAMISSSTPKKLIVPIKPGTAWEDFYLFLCTGKTDAVEESRFSV